MLIHKSMTDCVCFVCCYTKDGDLTPVGTGFFIGTQLTETDPPQYMGIVVTALHVINGIEDVNRSDNRIFLRVNTHDGGFDHVEIPSDDWVRPDPAHPDGIIDAAVCRFPHNNKDKFDFRFLGDEMIANRQTLLDDDIGIGNEVFSAGLFIMHTETKRNEPIVRSGTIAAMPETISSKSGPQHAYLVESRSVGGLSGSPVFVDAGLTRHDEAGKLRMRLGGRASYLLGLVSGHWRADAEIREIGEAIQREYVNMGIAIITPMEKVIPLIAACILKAKTDVADQVKAGVTGIAEVIIEGMKQLLTNAAELQKEQGLTNSEALKLAWNEVIKSKSATEPSTETESDT